jgi:hypothetical protein
MKVEGRRMTEIGEMISQRYCSGRDAGGHDAEERKAQMHNSLNSEEIIRTGTRITRIGRIYTDPCASVSSVQSVFTYALRGIGVRKVENPQGFGIDEHRFVHQVEIIDANALQLSEREIANKVIGAVPISVFTSQNRYSNISSGGRGRKEQWNIPGILRSFSAANLYNHLRNKDK